MNVYAAGSGIRSLQGHARKRHLYRPGGLHPARGADAGSTDKIFEAQASEE